MNIYQHFATYNVVPVKLSDVKAQVLETGLVSKIVRFPVEIDQYILRGGIQIFRDLTSYKSHELVAHIGYPRQASAGIQRLVCVKEMLHILDKHPETAATRDEVDRLVRELIIEPASKSIGLATFVDHTKLLNALCILAPSGALDILRPKFKNREIDADKVAAILRIPKTYAQLALSDEWKALAETIE